MKFRNLGNKIKSGYGALALIALNSIIMFLVLNLIASAIIDFRGQLRKKADAATGRYSFKKYEDPVKVLFPDLEKNDINTLLTEIRHVSQVFDTYTQFKEKPFVGKFVNVDVHGFRPIKDQGPWPPNSEKTNIFVFGGSTTFGYGVTDQQTIPSYMQEILTAKYPGKIQVYNFGRGGYISVQERVLFEKLIGSGIVPNVAVFIDGLNDLGYGDDDPPHTKELTKFMAEGEKPPFTNCVMQMPIFKLMFGHSNHAKAHSRNANEKIDNAIKRYEINRELIQAVSKAFTVYPLFVWQPIPVYKCEAKYNLFATFDYNRYMPYLKQGYENMVRHVANRQLGDNFLWLADMQEGLHNSLYADAIHYSPYLCRTIAGKIVDALESKKVFNND
ncbi:MAG: SGNH/GDSL hydrolase family protein [Deltaproteobacteria bacterium]|nr:SGNH/GDSL hydrolase family protein [Deltaproteobacteria bacterium]